MFILIILPSHYEVKNLRYCLHMRQWEIGKIMLKPNNSCKLSTARRDYKEHLS